MRKILQEIQSGQFAREFVLKTRPVNLDLLPCVVRKQNTPLRKLAKIY